MCTLNDKQNIFVVVPTYNESACMEDVVTEVATLGYSVVIVDDGSIIPIKPFLRRPNIYFLRHVINLGQGAALQSGIEFAFNNDAEYIVTFDADGQHQSSDIPNLIQPLHEGNYDIVLGSRFLRDNTIPFGRKWVLKGARYINYLFTGFLLTDAHNGFRAMTANAAKKIRITENKYLVNAADKTKRVSSTTFNR